MAGAESTGRTVYEISTDRYPSGELEIVSIRGVEQLSRPFSFEILVFAASIDVPSLERDLLGQRATLWIRGGAEEEARPIHGILRRVEAEGISSAGEHRHRFRLWLAPRLWLLGRGRNSRIFQDRTVPQILQAVLSGAHVPCAFRLLGTYAPRKYCVQHQESDLGFVRRLCAEEGIFFGFEHGSGDGGPLGAIAGLAEGALGALGQGAAGLVGDALGQAAGFAGGALGQAVGAVEGALGALAGAAALGGDVVVFCDSAHLCAPIAGSPDLVFRDSGGMQELDADVRRFRVQRRVAVGSTRILEFDFNRPSLDLTATAEVPRIEDAFDTSKLHFYDHHGEFERASVDAAAASRTLEQLRARGVIGEGESRCRRLWPGRWFTLAGDALPALDGRYTVVRVEHEGHHAEVVRAGGEARDVYKNRFFCVPEGVNPRPKRPRRRTQQVMETATVVGPAGQEIHTDELGRIKVQFHWDRAGQRNEHSSCWIRTMQAWAGTGWGFQFIPRIGMEVMVVFLTGDTDRPMVVGSVYNAEHPPPFPLPAQKTRSGIRTQTSRGGGGFNELSFEDRAGHERVFVHAQKDHETVVLHDQTTRVGNNRTEQVSANRYALVAGNDLTSVGGNMTRSVTGDDATAIEGSRSSRVEGNLTDVVTGRADVRIGEDLHTRVGGRERHEIAGAADRIAEDDETIRVHGCMTTIVGTHDARRSYTLRVEGVTELSGAGPTEITSEDEIVLRCGNSFIHMTSDRIDIVSPTISLQASGATLTAGDDELKMKATSRILGISDDKILLKSSGASVSLSADAKIDGSSVKLKAPDSASLSSEDGSSEPTTIELVDDQGDPIPYQRYVITLGNGQRRSGMLDKDGKAVIQLDESATIAFPGLPSAEEA